jgi:hypothetical protein
MLNMLVMPVNFNDDVDIPDIEDIVDRLMLQT